ncbi:MAG: FAD-dependent oxidoreductase [Armatimonadia bacterium]
MAIRDSSSSVEVLVCGAGLGGVAAALAATRAGASVLLVERNSYPGGVATAGMCCSIFNCYHTSGGEPGITGIPVEVADRLAEAEGYGRKWRDHKGHIIYDLEAAKLVLLELLLAAGVRTQFNTIITGALMDGNHLRGVVTESKSGREVIEAKAVVDATGDADVAAHAGVPLHVNERGLHSLCFRLGNVEVDRFVRYFEEHPAEYAEYMDVEWTLAEALAQYGECGTFLFPHGGGMQMQAFQRAIEAGDLPQTIGLQDNTAACQMHALRRTGIVHVITGFTHFDGLDIRLISESLNDGRRMAFTVAEVYRKYLPGFERAFIAGTADNLGVRTSRYLDGDFVFTADMMQAGRRCEDAVGRAVGWDDEVRHHGANSWGVQALREDSFDLPYRCLLPRTVEGLVMGAGRSISVEHPFLLRCMAHTMVVGQAAGTAAAVAGQQAVSPGQVAVSAVQAELRRQGVVV